MLWLKPSLALRWGSYTKLDGDEQQQIVTATIQSWKAGVITLRMAVEKLQPVYGIENVDAVLEALKKEKAENQQEALKNAAAMKKLAETNGNDSEPKSEEKPKEEAPPPPQGT